MALRYSSDDLAHIMNGVVRSMVEDISDDAVLCSIRTLSEDRERLVAAARYSKSQEPDMPELEESIPVGNGLSIKTVGGDAILTRKLQEVPSLKDDPRFSNQAIIRAGYRSMIAVPLIFCEESLGVAQIYTKVQGYHFSNKEKRLALTMAETLANLLVNKEYADEIQRLAEKSRRDTQHAMLGRVAALLVHDLKTPLVSLGGFARRIPANIADHEKVTQYAGIIIGSVETMEKTIEEILTFSKCDLSKTETDIIQLIRLAVQSTFFGEIKMECRPHRESRIIDIDPYRIGSIILELLKNAIDASKENGGKMIYLRTYEYVKRDHHGLCIEVENAGDISKENREKIFELSFTTKTHGTGIGLASALMVAEMHNGTIECESGNGRVTFRLYLPIAN